MKLPPNTMFLEPANLGWGMAWWIYRINHSAWLSNHQRQRSQSDPSCAILCSYSDLCGMVYQQISIDLLPIKVQIGSKTCTMMDVSWRVKSLAAEELWKEIQWLSLRHPSERLRQRISGLISSISLLKRENQQQQQQRCKDTVLRLESSKDFLGSSAADSLEFHWFGAEWFLRWSSFSSSYPQLHGPIWMSKCKGLIFAAPWDRLNFASIFWIRCKTVFSSCFFSEGYIPDCILNAQSSAEED